MQLSEYVPNQLLFVIKLCPTILFNELYLLYNLGNSCNVNEELRGIIACVCTWAMERYNTPFLIEFIRTRIFRNIKFPCNTSRTYLVNIFCSYSKSASKISQRLSKMGECSAPQFWSEDIFSACEKKLILNQTHQFISSGSNLTASIGFTSIGGEVQLQIETIVVKEAREKPRRREVNRADLDRQYQ